MKTRTLLPIALASMLMATAVAKDPTYKIVRLPKVGEKHSYNVNLDLKANIGGQPFSIMVKAETENSITDISKDGIITESSRQYNSKVSLNGTDQDQPESTSTTKSKVDGTLIEHKGDQEGPHNFRLHYLQTVLLPEKELKFGDTWSKTLESTADGVRKMSLSYTLVGIEKIGDKDYYKISLNNKELEGENASTFEGTEWLSVTDGNMAKMEGSITNIPLPESMPQDVAGKITVTLKS